VPVQCKPLAAQRAEHGGPVQHGHAWLHARDEPSQPLSQVLLQKGIDMGSGGCRRDVRTTERGLHARNEASQPLSQIRLHVLE
jgi:hypothetical protein